MNNPGSKILEEIKGSVSSDKQWSIKKSMSGPTWVESFKIG